MIEVIKMKSELTVITPLFASKLLESNTTNRPVRPSLVQRYSKELESGWKATHEGIAISVTGKILDGQHRLMAVVEAGIPIELFITTNVPDESFPHMNTGALRTPSDRMGTDPRVAGVISAASVVINNWKGKPTNEELFRIKDILYEKAHELVEFSGTAAKYFSAAHIKLVAVCYAIENGNDDEVFQLYSNLVNQKHEVLSKPCISWMLQVAKGQVVSANHKDAMNRMFLALSGTGHQSDMIVSEADSSLSLDLIKRVCGRNKL